MHPRVHRSFMALLALAAVVSILVGAPGARAAGAPPAPGEYAVDAATSSVGFSVTEFLVNTVTGTFHSFAGHVTVGDSLGGSKIQASVDVASIDTDVHMRDDHLRGIDYLDAQRFPKMQFASTVIWGAPENFGIKGNLTIKGVTKEVVFSAKIQNDGVIVAETKIDRTEFGITSGGTIKNEVKLRLQIHLVKA